MSETQEMVQLSGPIKVTSISAIDSREFSLLPAVKRQGSMKNLRGSDDGRASDDDNGLELSDFDELAAKRTQAREHESRPKTRAAVPRPTRARLTKSSRREDENQDPQDYKDLQSAHSDLCEELDMMHRENKDQSHELRDLKKQNMQIREEYSRLYNETTEDPQRFSKRERNKYHEHIQMMEQHIAYQRHELEKRDNHIEMLTKQTREANHAKDELDIGTRRLQRQIKELSINLTECKDDLLRLQPISQTSDSEIAEQYSNLCQQIAGWVDDQTEDAEVLEERFEGLKTTDDLNLDPTLALYTTEDHLRLAQEHPDSVPLLLQYLIHCYISQYVLGKAVYFYGLDAHNVGLIQQIEQGMELLEPKRDAVTLRKWRSEALHGLMKVEEFAAARAEQAEALAKSLYSALARMLGGADATVPEDGWKDLHKQIVLPAIELSTAIRIAMVDYHLVARLFRKTPERANTIYHNEIQHYQLIDNTTHKIIRPDSSLKIADDGRIGHELLIVSPALLRKKDEDHSAIISKPTILIMLDQPMEKRNRGIKGLTSIVSSFLGGEDGNVD